MAGASQKKQAYSNIQTLKEIHTLSAAINALTLAVLFVFNRPSTKKYYFIYLIPLLICEYIVEANGRPVIDQAGQILKSGDDLKQSGLTEYMFDLIYLTFACDILMVIFGSNKVWYIYTIVSDLINAAG